MTYFYNGRVYEVDLVKRSLDDEPEIFLIDPENRDYISIYDLPSEVADDLWIACEDLMVNDKASRADFAYDSWRDSEDFDWGFGNEDDQ